PAATGMSLLPLLEGTAPNWPNEAFSELVSSGPGEPVIRMIRKNRWKLVHFDGYRPQLFDLEADPHEFDDLGESPQHASIRDQLLRRVQSGWSTQAIASEVRERDAHRQVIRRWLEVVKPAAPLEQWLPPDDANVFPEPNESP
ncbi:MAG: DUF4976 domain-containing protein, partial [Acidimicrobiia bacterium]|nr:DUF4976 domain-containing protein [Acidimicrobiia bacterium]